RVPDMIGDIFSVAVMVAGAPEIRRVDALRARAEAVVFFELIAEPLDAPGDYAIGAVDRQRIDRGVLPRIERAPALRHMHRAPVPRIALGDVERPVAAALHLMDERDRGPRHAGFAGDGLIAR